MKQGQAGLPGTGSRNRRGEPYSVASMIHNIPPWKSDQRRSEPVEICEQEFVRAKCKIRDLAQRSDPLSALQEIERIFDGASEVTAMAKARARILARRLPSCLEIFEAKSASDTEAFSDVAQVFEVAEHAVPPHVFGLVIEARRRKPSRRLESIEATEDGGFEVSWSIPERERWLISPMTARPPMVRVDVFRPAGVEQALCVRRYLTAQTLLEDL